MIAIYYASVLVDDQAKARAFYTEVMGFKIADDVPLGRYNWLTVTSEPTDTHLILVPAAHPAEKAYQKALYDDRVPAIIFPVDNIQTEVARLKDRGVRFVREPFKNGPSIASHLDDTCGNIVQLFELV